MIKRRIAVWALALLLIASVCVTAFASEDDSDAQLGYVTDSAGVLTSEQVSMLERQAAQISRRHQFSVYIITVHDYRDTPDSFSIESSCIAMYDGYKLGWGPERAGAVMMLSMAERDYNLDFNGKKAGEAFTERGRDRMLNRILPYFGSDDYYRGFQEYLNCVDEYLTQAENGTPVGASKSGMGIFSAIPGAIAAMIASASLNAPMKTAKLKSNANSYVVSGSLNLIQQNDRFLHRTVTRQIRQQRSSGSGGSSYHSGSHSGRSGKF